jgi:hypothetical protein
MHGILSDKIPLWDAGVHGVIILKICVESETKIRSVQCGTNRCLLEKQSSKNFLKIRGIISHINKYALATKEECWLS